MTKLLPILFFIFLSTSITIAQSRDTQDIKTDLEDYLTAVKAKNVDKILDFMPPKMFEKASRAEMKKELEEGDLKNITFKRTAIKDVSSVIYHNKSKYAVVKYFSEAVLQLPKKDEDKMESMLMVMKRMLGEDNVALNKAKRQITMSIDSEMYAILSPGVKGWKFIQKDKDDGGFLKDIVPKEVQDKF